MNAKCARPNPLLDLKFKNSQDFFDGASFIRPACSEDGSQIQKIYAPFVAYDHITYEYRVPTAEEMSRRIEQISRYYPWIVYEKNGQILGYAHAYEHRRREGYKYVAETGIYIHEDHRKQGIGKKLYSMLLELMKLQGFFCAVAWISVPNEKSVLLHEALGFKHVGKYRVGFKHGKWRETVMMHKELNFMDDKEELVAPPPPISFPQLLGYSE